MEAWAAMMLSYSACSRATTWRGREGGREGGRSDELFVLSCSAHNCNTSCEMRKRLNKGARSDAAKDAEDVA